MIYHGISKKKQVFQHLLGTNLCDDGRQEGRQDGTKYMLQLQMTRIFRNGLSPDF